MTNTSLSSRERQQQLNAEIVIIGMPDWRTELNKKLIKLRPGVEHLFGGKSEVPYVDAAVRGAEINDVSFEREFISDLLTDGAVLEELEIELTHKPEWGRMVWQKEHANYLQPPPDIYKEAFAQGFFTAPFYFATFKTEHAGEQTFTLYSTQMLTSARLLLHKTILFHKVVLSPPK